MYQDESEETTSYKVVVNHEGQYSIWLADRDNALGWDDVGERGTRVKCLELIDQIWTDMRPLSLRKTMEEDAGKRIESPAAEPAEGLEDDGGLVKRLCAGEHVVEASLRPEPTVARLRECIERGYVHIRFPNTRGRTELGVRVDRGASDFSGADFGQQTGSVHLVGTLSLDGVKVRCIADVDLQTFQGKGCLELAKPAE